MSSAEFFNKLISMALKAEIHNELTPRNNIISFLSEVECELGHILSHEFKKRYDEGYDVGQKDGYKDGYNKGYVDGCKEGYDDACDNFRLTSVVD